MATLGVKIWTDEEVERLNKRQQDGSKHPYTCPGYHSDFQSLLYGGTVFDTSRILTATNYGWVCDICNYRQLWAHLADRIGGE